MKTITLRSLDSSVDVRYKTDALHESGNFTVMEITHLAEAEEVLGMDFKLLDNSFDNFYEYAQENDLIMEVEDIVKNTKNRLYPSEDLAFVTEAALPDGTNGVAYSETIEVTGGSGDYTFAVADGSDLPSGLELDDETGEISGNPDTTADNTFTIDVTDSIGYTESREFTLNVVAA